MTFVSRWEAGSTQDGKEMLSHWGFQRSYMPCFGVNRQRVSNLSASAPTDGCDGWLLGVPGSHGCGREASGLRVPRIQEELGVEAINPR